MAKAKIGKLGSPKKLWGVKASSSGPLAVRDGVVCAPLVEKAGSSTAAIDVASGEVRWRSRDVLFVSTEQSPVFGPSAIWIRAGGSHGASRLVGLAWADGALVADVPCREAGDLAGIPMTHVGPLAAGGHAIVVSGGMRIENTESSRVHVVAFDTTTGARVYDIALPEGLILHTAHADGEVVVVSARAHEAGAWRGRLFAYRAVDGTQLWTNEADLVGAAAGGGTLVADARDARAAERDTASEAGGPSTLVALDLSTGVERFRRAMPWGWKACVIDEGLFVVEHDVDVRWLLDPVSGAERWIGPSPYTDVSHGLAAGSRRFTRVAGRVWITGGRGTIVGFSLESGAPSKTNIRGLTLASDTERLLVGDASSLTAYQFG